MEGREGGGGASGHQQAAMVETALREKLLYNLFRNISKPSRIILVLFSWDITKLVTSVTVWILKICLTYLRSCTVILLPHILGYFHRSCDYTIPLKVSHRKTMLNMIP
jgi:hypothetical protein